MSRKQFTIQPNIVRDGLIAWYDVGFNCSASTCDVGAGVSWSGIDTPFPLSYAGDASDPTITGAEFDGLPGHGFSFGGGGSADQHFAMGNTGAVDDLTKFTIEVWSKLRGPTGVSCGMIAGQIDPAAANRNDSVFSLRYAAESGPAKYPHVDGVTNIIIVGFGDGSAVQTGKPIIQYESAAQVQSNEWQHIVYTQANLPSSGDCGGDNSGRTHDGKLFIDGVEDIPTGKKNWGCAALSAQYLTEIAADLRVGIGEIYASNGDIGRNWHGEIGCVRIYDRALSHEEIVQNYIATHRRFPAPVPNQIQYYAHRGDDFGVLLTYAKGTLDSWNSTNRWWNMDIGTWSNPYYIGDDGNDVMRAISSVSPRAEIRVEVGSGYEGGNNTPPNTETFFEQYPNSFLRAKVDDVYYDCTVQEDTGNEEQFKWQTPQDVNWTIENIHGGGTGKFGFTSNTEVELQLWSGHTH